MRRRAEQGGIFLAVALALLLANFGFFGWASAIGASLVSAATCASLFSPEAPRNKQADRWALVLMTAVFGFVGGAAVYAGLRHILGPAYPVARAASESMWTPLVITVVLGGSPTGTFGR